jgi:hypothetical protein
MSRNKACEVVDGLYVETVGPRRLRKPNDQGRLTLNLTYYGNQHIEISPKVDVEDVLDIVLSTGTTKSWSDKPLSWVSADPAPSQTYQLTIRRNNTLHPKRYSDITCGCGTVLERRVVHEGPMTRVQCRVN